MCEEKIWDGKKTGSCFVFCFFLFSPYFWEFCLGGTGLFQINNANLSAAMQAKLSLLACKGFILDLVGRKAPLTSQKQCL